MSKSQSVIRCYIAPQEIHDAPFADNYSLARILVSKGFKSEGGPIKPKLIGQIGYTIDFETGNYCYFQLV